MSESAPRILRLPEVERRTGLKRDTIYRRAKLGEFPKPIRIGARASGWVESEVTDYIQKRIAAAH